MAAKWTIGGLLLLTLLGSLGGYKLGFVEGHRTAPRFAFTIPPPTVSIELMLMGEPTPSATPQDAWKAHVANWCIPICMPENFHPIPAEFVPLPEMFIVPEGTTWTESMIYVGPCTAFALPDNVYYIVDHPAPRVNGMGEGTIEACVMRFTLFLQGKG